MDSGLFVSIRQYGSMYRIVNAMDSTLAIGRSGLPVDRYGYKSLASAREHVRAINQRLLAGASKK